MVDSYHDRRTGEPFLPVLVGSVKRIAAPHESSKSSQTIQLGFPSAPGGHAVDVVCWDQLHMLRRVMEMECANFTYILWDLVQRQRVHYVLRNVEPWSVGPASDVDPRPAGDCIYVCVDQNCVIVRSTPTRLFRYAVSGPSGTSSSSSMTLDDHTAFGVVEAGNLVAVRCTLHCNHRAVHSEPGTFIRTYSLVARELSVIV
ncbi:hypothetical protein B0H13DRAFT_2461995 [Mycena leptocephala]|nr:hypothetical protein B0H13DRAFT_2461995 [Mycena leptocephala]